MGWGGAGGGQVGFHLENMSITVPNVKKNPGAYGDKRIFVMFDFSAFRYFENADPDLINKKIQIRIQK